MQFKIEKRWRDWLAVVLIGLLVQAFWALRMDHPTYMDAYYYTVNGQRLADGFGFTVPVVWQFLDGIRTLPAPAHTYWMPLPSLLAALGYLAGDSFRFAQFPFWLLAGMIPWLSYLISQALGAARWQAWAAAIFTAFGGYYAAYLSQPTTFAPFAWAGGLGLLLLARVAHAQGQRWHWLAAGVLAGLAHLTRADGILFLPLAWLLWLRLGLNGRRWRLPSLKPIVAHGVGYLLVMGGWFARNMAVMGQPMPTAGTQTMFLTNYNDLFSYGRSFGLENYLAWGLENILASKLEALSLTVQTFVAVSGLVFLAPFVLWGWVACLRRQQTRAAMRPLSWFTLLLLGVMVLLFTFPAGRGSVLHSSAAVWPWMMPLALIGLGLAVEWMAKRLSHWQPERAKPIFAALFGVVVFVVSPIVSSQQPLRIEEAALIEEIGVGLPASAVVMAGNPPMIFYHTGLAAISIPSEPLDRVQLAAADFGVTHLLLDFDHPEFMEGVWAGETNPSWLQHLDDYYSGTEGVCRPQREEGAILPGDEECLVFRLFEVQP